MGALNLSDAQTIADLEVGAAAATILRRAQIADEFPAISVESISFDVPDNTPNSTRELIGYCFRLIGEDAAEDVIRAARIDLVRAHVESALFWNDQINRMRVQGYDAEADSLSERNSPERTTMQWHNADEMSREPWRMLDLEFCAARVLYERTQELRLSPAKYPPGVLLTGMALSWVLDALKATVPLTVLELMSEAGQALELAGYCAGWDGALECYKINSNQDPDAPMPRTMAHLGADARHATNRANKAACLKWYRDNRDRFTSKDAAAIEATKLFEAEFSTIRNNWLKGKNI